uniref:Uncharacterized protein n=1 Tax=Anguilla anguilla TaxID=7936 RepID=A0A0E9UNI9_ANGAN
MEGAETLRSSYNYDTYLTTGSRTSDFKFARSYNDCTTLVDQTLKRSPGGTEDNEISEPSSKWATLGKYMYFLNIFSLENIS